MLKEKAIAIIFEMNEIELNMFIAFYKGRISLHVRDKASILDDIVWEMPLSERRTFRHELISLARYRRKFHF